MDVKIIDKEYKFKYRVAGIIIINNKLLVDRYGNDSYCLPGGYVEIGETSITAIKRELKEEINIDFDIVSLVGIIENFFINIRGDKTHSIELYYKVKLKNKEDLNLINYNNIELDKGHLVKHHYKWLDIDKLDSYKILPNQLKKEIINNNNFHLIIEDE